MDRSIENVVGHGKNEVRSNQEGSPKAVALGLDLFAHQQADAVVGEPICIDIRYDISNIVVKLNLVIVVLVTILRHWLFLRTFSFDGLRTTCSHRLIINKIYNHRLDIDYKSSKINKKYKQT